jgi:hypothetical protein
MEHLIYQGIVNHLLNLGTHIHIDQLVIAHIGMHTVRKKDIDQLIFGVGPCQCSRKTGVPIAGG